MVAGVREAFVILPFSFDRSANMETQKQGICKATAAVFLLTEALYHGPDDDLGELHRHFSPHVSTNCEGKC